MLLPTLFLFVAWARERKRFRTQADLSIREAASSAASLPRPALDPQLGELDEAVARSWSLAYLNGVGVLGFFFLSAGALIIFGSVRPTAWTSDVLALTFCGLFGLLCCVGMCLYAAYRGREQLWIYADGLVYQYGREPVVCRWDEIDCLKGFVPVTMRGQEFCYGAPLEIQRSDGTRLFIRGNLRDHDRVVRTIHDRAIGHMLPRALQRIDRGETVEFGPLRVHRDGIEYRDLYVVWDALVVRDEEGNVTIYDRVDREPLFDKPKWKLPNAMLFLELVRVLRRRAKGTDGPTGK
jgi:hypothetical protein